jgi:hypothetical protein
MRDAAWVEHPVLIGHLLNEFVNLLAHLSFSVDLALLFDLTFYVSCEVTRVLKFFKRP